MCVGTNRLTDDESLNGTLGVTGMEQLGVNDTLKLTDLLLLSLKLAVTTDTLDVTLSDTQDPIVVPEMEPLGGYDTVALTDVLLLSH